MPIATSLRDGKIDDVQLQIYIVHTVHAVSEHP